MTELVIIIGVVFDAWRDTGINRKPEVSWWNWHIKKWLAYYTPMTYLYLQLDYWNTIPGVLFVLAMWILWKLTYAWAIKGDITFG